MIDRPGGIFVRPVEQISDEDRILLQSVARAVLSDSRGTLAEQVASAEAAEPRDAANWCPSAAYRPSTRDPARRRARDLTFFNGLGGFTPDGREYVITTDAAAGNARALGQRAGQSRIRHRGLRERRGYTWAENAHEFRLTPWDNDPVSDAGGEAFLPPRRRDRTLLVAHAAAGRGAEPYVTRHGFGYSVFEHIEDGIRSELTVYVAIDAPVKFSVLEDPQRLRPHAQTLRDRLRGMGAGRPARRNRRCTWSPKSTPQRRDLRAQSLQHRIRRPGGVLRRRAMCRRTVTGDRTDSSGATARCALRRP